MKLTALSSIYSLIPYRNIKLSYDNVSKWIHGWILNYQIRMILNYQIRTKKVYTVSIIITFSPWSPFIPVKPGRPCQKKSKIAIIIISKWSQHKSLGQFYFLFFFLLYLVYQYQFLLQYISLVKFESCRTNNTYI